MNLPEGYCDTELAGIPTHLWNGLRVRIGIDSGVPLSQKDPCTGRIDYFGPTVNKAARVESQAVGGMISATYDIVDSIVKYLPALGNPIVSHFNTVRLKGIADEVEIFCLVPKVLEDRQKTFEAAKQPTKPSNEKQPSPQEEYDDEIPADDFLYPEGEVAVVIIEVVSHEEIKSSLSDTDWHSIESYYRDLLNESSTCYAIPYIRITNGKAMAITNDIISAFDWCLHVQQTLQDGNFNSELLTQYIESQSWDGEIVLSGLQVRIAMHVMPKAQRSVDLFSKQVTYHGPEVSFTSIMADYACAGQTLLSDAAKDALSFHEDQKDYSIPYAIMYLGVVEEYPDISLHQAYPVSLLGRYFLFQSIEDTAQGRQSNEYEILKSHSEICTVDFSAGDSTRERTSVFKKIQILIPLSRRTLRQTLENCCMGLFDVKPTATPVLKKFALQTVTLDEAVYAVYKQSRRRLSSNVVNRSTQTVVKNDVPQPSSLSRKTESKTMGKTCPEQSHVLAVHRLCRVFCNIVRECVENSTMRDSSISKWLNLIKGNGNGQRRSSINKNNVATDLLAILKKKTPFNKSEEVGKSVQLLTDSMVAHFVIFLLWLREAVSSLKSTHQSSDKASYSSTRRKSSAVESFSSVSGDVFSRLTRDSLRRTVETPKGSLGSTRTSIIRERTHSRTGDSRTGDSLQVPQEHLQELVLYSEDLLVKQEVVFKTLFKALRVDQLLIFIGRSFHLEINLRVHVHPDVPL